MPGADQLKRRTSAGAARYSRCARAAVARVVAHGLARQVARVSPSRLVLLERSEPALYTIDRELREAWPSLSIVAVVGDVGDRERMFSVFREVRPGEKLFEELQYGGEAIDKTWHSKIFIGKIAGVPASELDAALASLRALALGGSSGEIRAFLGAFLPEAQMNGGAAPGA